MKHLNINWLTILVIMSVVSLGARAQVRMKDGFENKNGWAFNKSDGVNLNLSNEKGLTGNAIRLDYDFTKGTGYGGIQKLFPVDLPENFEFTFYIKAQSPANNFEIKFIDSTGNNVWWVNNRNYDFPAEWKKITIKKRHISFAWGPTADQHIKRIDRVEFTIASFVGGKGTIWLDNFTFEPLPPETNTYPAPLIKATSSVQNHLPRLITDNSTSTFWKSKGLNNQNIIIDFKTRREFGGLQIDWHKEYYAGSFEIFLSNDGKTWEKSYSVKSNHGDVSFIRLAETEARYLKINLLKSGGGKGFGISEIKFLTVKESLTKNDFLIYTAKNSPVGNFPRYFLEQASYWTIAGVNNDVKEAMISEDGMIEVDKGLFSLEPMIKTGDSVYNWHNVKSSQSLGAEGTRDFNFIPTVTWQMNGLYFKTSITGTGEANKNSKLDIRYTFTNTSGQPLDFEFYILIRPYQVNPYYQFLNMTGGVGKIKSIRQEGDYLLVDDKVVLFEKKFNAFGASGPDEGNLAALIRHGKMPLSTSAEDRNSLANGVVKYILHLGAGETLQMYAAVPFYGKNTADGKLSITNTAAEFEKSAAFWNSEVGHIKFNLPPSADRIVNAYKSNLGYVLVNRDKAGIQPGSRSYERSWIRDGALTSSALLKSGIVTEVKDFINWYAPYQYENGKVPCVVDNRGPDPVPENDSHGQLIPGSRIFQLHARHRFPQIKKRVCA
ncbi:MAG TPA: discoidin domain-containing protein [Bacteroidales bacterium]|nr:discoidin domain-containing protein [Bacteroidales bacterium]